MPLPSELLDYRYEVAMTKCLHRLTHTHKVLCSKLDATRHTQLICDHSVRTESLSGRIPSKDVLLFRATYMLKELFEGMMRQKL